jgi:asparagine synthase (glutamine-hydrolysing)
MCGIAGIMSVSEAPDENSIRQMTNAIAHRGPDGEGVWIDVTGKVGFGHRRLAIIDLSDNGKQPMHFLDNKYTITFNGEIYNYLEIRKYLIQKGYRFQTESDTEIIMAAFDHWGVDCLNQFDGMFAFAIFNRENNQLFCARDRFGEKPFYYHIDQSGLMFASEMKSLWAAGVNKEVNDQNVYLFLNFTLHENPSRPTSTFFNSINKLQAGHYFIYRSGKSVVQKPYWKIDLKNQNNEISFEESCVKFKELFFTSVNRRLRSDVSLGTSLSGGLDSSAVVLTIEELLKNKTDSQKTFSARFNDEKLDEGYFMNKVIQGKNIKHFCTYPDLSVMMNELPKIMYHQEEPFSTASIYAQWEVFKLAKKENVIVLLDGQGADEYLGGYTHFFVPYFREKYLQGGKQALQKVITEMKDKNILQDDIILDRFFKTESHFPDLFNGVRKIKHNLFGVSHAPDLHSSLLEKYNKEQAPFENFISLNEALYYSTFNSGLEKLLKFADRNSMAFSREVRLPFLNHDLVEFVFSLPSDHKMRNGWTKAILRYGLQDILPPEIAWRKNKLGFQPPQKKWMGTKEWKEWSNDYHNISVRKNWIKNEVSPSWKSINMGVFEEMLQTL